jgi:hypothetical protein
LKLPADTSNLHRCNSLLKGRNNLHQVQCNQNILAAGFLQFQYSTLRCSTATQIKHLQSCKEVFLKGSNILLKRDGYCLLACLSIAISLVSNFPLSSSNQRTATILKMYKQYLLTSQLESEVTLLITLHNLDNDCQIVEHINKEWEKIKSEALDEHNLNLMTLGRPGILANTKVTKLLAANKWYLKGTTFCLVAGFKDAAIVANCVAIPVYHHCTANLWSWPSTWSQILVLQTRICLHIVRISHLSFPIVLPSQSRHWVMQPHFI